MIQRRTGWILITTFFCTMGAKGKTSQDTCTMVDGQVYQKGDNLGTSFVTRCGSASAFPCFCDPSAEFQAACPYCSFATQSGETICANDQQTVTFQDIDGKHTTCTCQVSNVFAQPLSSCFSQLQLSSTDTCQIPLPDGSTGSFASGESLGDVLPNRCGSNFPCYCNPASPNGIYCPYCRFATMGSNLLCARDGQTVTFTDDSGIDQMCRCIVPLNDTTSNFTSACTVSNNSSPSQTPYPSPSLLFPTSPTVVADPLPTRSATIVSDVILSPSPMPNIFTSRINDTVCNLVTSAGQTITFQDGESYGSYVTTRCGSTTQYPCYCDLAATNKIYCPYCGFVTGDGILYCAKDQQTISFVDGTITRQCNCTFPPNSTYPLRVCTVIPNGSAPVATPPVSSPPTTGTGVPTPTAGGGGGGGVSGGCPVTITNPNGNTNVTVIANGASFGDLYQGACGPSSTWPAFCFTGPTPPPTPVTSTAPTINATQRRGQQEQRQYQKQSQRQRRLQVNRQLQTSATTATTTNSTLPPTTNSTTMIDPTQINYPYCVVNNTKNGTILCGHDTQNIVFLDANGVNMTCACLVATPDLGGPQTYCYPTPMTPPTGNAPASSPVINRPIPTPPVVAPSPMTQDVVPSAAPVATNDTKKSSSIKLRSSVTRILGGTIVATMLVSLVW